MQKFRITSIALSAGLAILSSTLLSFSFGGDSLEIYLNQKMVLQQFMHVDKSIKTIALDQSDYDKQLNVYYRHCGIAGKGRKISVQDESHKLVKSLQFADGADKNAVMSMKVKDLFPGKNIDGKKVQLYYTSKEMPEGKLLATLVYSNHSVAAR
jgi:hypothetical protein